MFIIGSEEEDGAHRPDSRGWPYSIFIPGYGGRSDAVLCHGIQHLDDAEQLLALCNGDIRPPIMSGTQMFAWGRTP